MFKRILVALDGHPAGLTALAPAQSLARAFEAEMRLVSVEWPVSPRGREWKLTQAAYLDKRKRELEHYLETWADKLRGQGLRVSSAVLPLGSPVARLLEEIEAWQPDLVVLSSRGRRGLARWALGSVAEELSRQLCCATLIVHPAKEGTPAWQQSAQLVRAKRSRIQSTNFG